ncbi:MAG: hypothetical protein ABR949_05770 [Candidatus Aquilonibacter sp.]|jgi:hypothetical protein
MIDMLRRALSVLVILALAVAIAAPPRPVRAGWNWTGKTWTTAIIIAAGGAAIGYLLTYVAATKQANGSVRQAQAVMDLPMYGTPATPAAQSTAIPSLSMQQLRGLIIASVASAIRNSSGARRARPGLHQLHLVARSVRKVTIVLEHDTDDGAVSSAIVLAVGLRLECERNGCTDGSQWYQSWAWRRKHDRANEGGISR